MIRNGHLVEDVHRRHDHPRLAAMSYMEALGTYTSLWVEARALGADGSRDWEEDLMADLAIARTLNALPAS